MANLKIYRDIVCDNFTTGNLTVLTEAILPSDNEVIPTDDQGWDAYRQQQMRNCTAFFERAQDDETGWPTNGDQEGIPLFLGMFTKGLSHNAQGRVTASQYQHLAASLKIRNTTLLTQVPLAGTRKFVQPLGALNLNVVGPAPSSITVGPAPSFSSTESAGEMVEDYCHLLCRDVPFADYTTDPTVASCIGYLNSLSNFKGNTPVTAANIFRGTGTGDTTGPYISQFLIQDREIWPGVYPPTFKFPTRTSANNKMVTVPNWLAVQNGTVPEAEPTISGSDTYVATGRDMSWSVRNDLPAQWWYLAAGKSANDGIPLSPVNPYNNPPLNSNMESFPTWSIVDVITVLQIVTQVALQGAWYAKWFAHRRTRPEAFGGEVEQVRLTTTNPGGINSEVLTSGVLADIFAIQGNHLLGQVYPEGSPMHPAYPAGHATFSGACTTVLKAFFNENYVFPTAFAPNAAGTALVATGDTLTFGEEANKLASNVTFGRDWAGVHYRSDGEQGILLGETLALRVLQDWIEKYNEDGAAFTFHGYKGNSIAITPLTAWGRTSNAPST